MDFLTKHWAPYPRRHPSTCPLVSSEYLAEKATWVDTRFGTCNFSIILSGEGRFEKDGKTWPVQAPCVITQWPGESTIYGPTEGSWTEWYLVYHRSAFNRFQDCGLIDLQKPVWSVADPVSLHIHLAEFAALARASDPTWVVDRVDRIAEQAILDTWLAPGAPWKSEAGISVIATSLREGLSSKWDFEKLAAKHGYSTTTFRRRWIETFGSPPAKYLQELRMAEACRLLVETNLRIKEIATLTGFDDELYFSRRFHLEIGQSPRQYRKTYRLRN
ncbi:MAG: AraC family transcriptional regulator [Terrimicrobiaceae bacterium]